MSNIHTLFPSNVVLEPITHTYMDNKGLSYLSVSKFLEMLSERFEDTFAYKRADLNTKTEWKTKGELAKNHGTNIHQALELYNNTGYILQENIHMEDVIKSILAEYGSYNKCYDEICLYNDKYRIAGTTDKICTISNRKDCEVDIVDFKTNISKGIYYVNDYKKRMYAPLDHLQDCNYVKYSLQLSIYAYFFEELTGRKVRQLHIHFIPPNDMMNHVKIPVIYMKNDVKLLLDQYKYRIVTELNGVKHGQLEELEEF